MPAPSYSQILAELALTSPGKYPRPEAGIAERLVPQANGGEEGLPKLARGTVNQGLTQYDNQGNPLPGQEAGGTDTSPSIASQVGDWINSHGAQSVPGGRMPLDNQGNPIPEQVPPEAVGTNPDGSFMTQLQAAANSSQPAPTSEFPGDIDPVKPKAPDQPQPHHVPRGTSGPAKPDQWQGYVDQGDKSIEESANIAGQSARAQADTIDQATRQQQAIFNENEAYQQQLNAQKQHFLSKQEALIDASAGAIDPNKFWQTQTGAKGVLARISMILGGVGGSMMNQPGASATGGGANTSPIAGLIQQNIALQKDQMERQGKAANAYGDLYRNLTAEGLTHMQASEGATKMMQAISENQVKSMVDRYVGPAARANAPLLEANLGINTQMTKATAMAHLGAAADSNADANLKTFQLGQSKKFAQWIAEQGMPQGAPQGSIVSDSGGRYGISVNGEAGSKNYNEAVAPARDIRNVVGQIEKIRAGGQESIVAHAGELDNLQRGLQQAMSKLGGADLSSRTGDFYKAIGKPGQLFHIIPSHGWESQKQGLLDLANEREGRAAQENGVVFGGGGGAPPAPPQDFRMKAKR